MTRNRAGGETCAACGAPFLPDPPADPPPVNLAPARKAAAAAGDYDELRQAGESAEKLVNQALGAYGLLWRTAGEAFAIGLASLLLGIIGGASGNFILAVAAGLGIGLVVGLRVKGFWMVIWGAPLGVILGALLGLLVWALGAGPLAMLLMAEAFGVLGALLWSASPGAAQSWWERLRPILGAAGGVFFALLGGLAGLILNSLAGGVFNLWRGF